MWLLWLFETTGLVFGLLILPAGAVALGLCLRASLPAGAPAAPRVAVTVSLLPLAVGVCAALVGLGLWLAGVMPEAGRSDAALNPGRAGLAGPVTTALPLAWALALARLRREKP